MVFSNERKLNLSGWLQAESCTEYNSPLKLQKFLLFYELFSEIDDGDGCFSHLQGWKKGPVFSNVWGDYTKERVAFNNASMSTYRTSKAMINIDRAELSSFLVKILSEDELSGLTHKLNLWASKKDKILSGEKYVDLDIADFNENDREMINILKVMYPPQYINSVDVLTFNNKSFILRKDDFPKLTEFLADNLMDLSHGTVDNPIYISIGAGEELYID